MLNLDPEFRTLLLAHHSRSAKPEEIKLLSDSLDDYEELVGRLFMLRRMEHELPGTEVRIKAERATITSRIKRIITTSFPDFYKVHSAWSARRQSIELGNANRAYSPFLRARGPEKGGVSGFAAFLGTVVVVCGIGIVTILGTGDRPGKVGPQLMHPDSVLAYQPGTEELDAWKRWEELNLTGDSLALSQRFALQLLAQKMLGRAVLWAETGDSTRAMQSLLATEKLGSALMQAFGDSLLARQTAQIRRLYFGAPKGESPELMTTK